MLIVNQLHKTIRLLQLLFLCVFCLGACFVQYEQEHSVLILLLLVRHVLKILHKIALFNKKCLIIFVLFTLLICFKFQKIRNGLLIDSKVTVQGDHKFMKFGAWTFAFSLEVIIILFWEMLFRLESDLGKSQNVGMWEGSLIWAEWQVMQELWVVLLSFLRVDNVVGQHNFRLVSEIVKWVKVDFIINKSC